MGEDEAQWNQAFWSEFWVLSGPNFQSEEGANPNTWVKCGDPAVTGGFGDANCDNEYVVESVGDGDGVCEDGETCAGNGGGIDSVNIFVEDIGVVGGDDDGICDLGETCITVTAKWSFVAAAGTGGIENGLDLISRYGEDLRPGADTNGVCDASGQGGCDTALDATVMVICVPGGLAANAGLAGGFVAIASDCESDAGADNVYGTGDDGTLYYGEALENGLRGFIRENHAVTFSFANFGGGGGGFFGGNNSKYMRQAVAQNTSDGMLVSCLNCEDIPDHVVNTHATPEYLFTWTIDGVDFVSHTAAISGAQQSIP
jgi:hypothetical protein